MKKYLLDTNICIYYLKGAHNLDKKLSDVGFKNCYISEISLAELKFGAANSSNPQKNQKVVNKFRNKVKVLPIYNALDLYAEEKSRLRTAGKMVDDFDLLIGATAVTNDLILVTNNVAHFENISKIIIENWVGK